VGRLRQETPVGSHLDDRTFHREQLPLNSVVGLIDEGGRHRYLRICELCRSARLLILTPAPHPCAVGSLRRGNDVVRKAVILEIDCDGAVFLYPSGSLTQGPPTLEGHRS